MPKRLIATLTCLGLTTGALAHGGATGIVLERMEEMKSIGQAMKTIAAQAKGERDFDQAAIRESAAAIEGHARKAATLFPDTPKSRNGARTEATPAVWAERERFDELMDELRRDAGKLAARPDLSREALGPALAGLAQTCKTCHETYRVKK